MSLLHFTFFFKVGTLFAALLNKVSSIKETALHHAVAIENIKIIKLLLGHKDINVNQQDENGKKPIDYCKNEKIKRIFHL